MPMSDFVERMMFAYQLSIEDGEIVLLGFRMAMLPTYTLTKLIEELYQSQGDEAFETLFRVGRHHGNYATDVLGEQHDVPRKQFLNETLDSSGILGLGKFNLEVQNFDEGRMVFSLENSPFPGRFRESNVLSNLTIPVDHLQRGMVHGIAEDMFAEPVTSKETKCEYLGDSHCRVVLQTDDDVNHP